MGKRIVLTGGGTAGHVTPNIALLPSLRDADYEVFYIGSYDWIEKDLVTKQKVPYYGIASGKLRLFPDERHSSLSLSRGRKENKGQNKKKAKNQRNRFFHFKSSW